jgi:uncharacterized protein YbcI
MTTASTQANGSGSTDMHDTDNPPTPLSSNGDRAAAISNLVMKLTSEYTGRGPTKARTHMHDDVVTVILQNALTKGERTLVTRGRHELVQSTRFAFQQTMADELVRGVEEITERPVLAFMSANHLEPDMAAEIFVLGPSTLAATV